jgi:hypothetical protein
MSDHQSDMEIDIPTAQGTTPSLNCINRFELEWDISPNRAFILQVMGRRSSRCERPFFIHFNIFDLSEKLGFVGQVFVSRLWPLVDGWIDRGMQRTESI